MYKTSGSIHHEGSDIEVLRVGTHYPGTENMQQLTLPNAYCQDEGTSELLWHAENTIAVAERLGVPMQMTLHNSPDAYGFVPRFSRYYGILKHELRDDQEQLLQGFSWGWPQVLLAAELLDGNGYKVGAAQGLAPNSLTPWTRQPGCLLTGVVDLVRAAKIESTAYAEHMLTKKIEKGDKNRALLKHIAANLMDASAEVGDLLFHDNVALTVDLQHKLGIFTTIFACDRDRVCRSDRMERNLQQARFPMEQFVRLHNTAHIEAVYKHAHSERIFRALVMKEVVEAPPQPRILALAA